MVWVEVTWLSWRQGSPAAPRPPSCPPSGCQSNRSQGLKQVSRHLLSACRIPGMAPNGVCGQCGCGRWLKVSPGRSGHETARSRMAHVGEKMGKRVGSAPSRGGGRAPPVAGMGKQLVHFSPAPRQRCPPPSAPRPDTASPQRAPGTQVGPARGSWGGDRVRWGREGPARPGAVCGPRVRRCPEDHVMSLKLKRNLSRCPVAKNRGRAITAAGRFTPGQPGVGRVS